MPTRQHKRLYTGSQLITSYFPSTSAPNEHTYSLSAPPSPQHPVLPPSIQSSLLNVGMRVRKSVPEGYKTGQNKVYGYQSFAEGFTVSPPGTPLPLKYGDIGSSMDKEVTTRPRAGVRELTPFCGMHSVGGMAAQQWGIYSPSGGASRYYEEAIEAEEDMDDVPFLSSQGSTISSSSCGGNKRRFLEDEESEEVPFGGMESGIGERKIKELKRKKWVGNGAREGDVRIVGQGVFGAAPADDFQEANFLDFQEVEMEM